MADWILVTLRSGHELVRTSDIKCVISDTGKIFKSEIIKYDKSSIRVRESPSEVMALLAPSASSGQDREGKAEGTEAIWDVIEKTSCAAANDYGVKLTLEQTQRLVAYFDGRKTDA